MVELTPIQRAYLSGRRRDLKWGGVPSLVYAEFEASEAINHQRLGRAITESVHRHEILRATISHTGEQKILSTVPTYEVGVHDLSTSVLATEKLLEYRLRTLLEGRPLEQWPLFDVRVFKMPGGAMRLAMSVDMLIADGKSLLLLASEWTQERTGSNSDEKYSVRSIKECLQAQHEFQHSEKYQIALDFWVKRAKNVAPAPVLPLVGDASSALPRTKAYRTTLCAQESAKLRKIAAAEGLTMTSLLLSIYADVVRRWSDGAEFAISVTHSNEAHCDHSGLVGPWSSFVPITAKGPSSSAFVDRARSLQKELWTALEHRFVHGVDILRILARARGSQQSAMSPVVFTPLFQDIRITRSFGKIKHLISQTSQVLLDCQILLEGSRLVLLWSVAENLFQHGVCSEMFEAYVDAVRSAADGTSVDSQPIETALRARTEKEKEESNLVESLDTACGRPTNTVSLVTTERPVTYDRRALRDIQFGSDSPEILDLNGPREGMIAEIGAIFGQVLQVDAIPPDLELATLGIDSIELVKIGNRLEARYGLRPSLEDLFSVRTISDVASLCLPPAPDASCDHRISEVDTPAEKTNLILDLDLREKFKRSAPAIRSDLSFRQRYRLADTSLRGDDAILHRRSRRRFLDTALNLESLGRLLALLRREERCSTYPRYFYPSAGSVYAVQTYLYVKPRRIERLRPGTYYYHPQTHELCLLAGKSGIDSTAYSPANRSIFEQAGFAVFFIASLAAMRPLYGQYTRDFCLIESGAMAQVLSTHAHQQMLGLCSIGYVRRDQVLRATMLNDDYEIVHSMLGGAIGEVDEANENDALPDIFVLDV
jgi:SagB-type dehydrogenase family enzyme